MNGEEVRAVSAKLDTLAQGQAALETQFAGLRGVVETTLERHTDEIGVLFEQRGKHERRIAEIEKTYVTDAEHTGDMKDNREEHKEFHEAVDDQRTFSGKLVGGAIVLGMVGSALLAWLLKS